MSSESTGLAEPIASPSPGRHLPGVEGVWVFVFADMVVFAVMFGSFMADRQSSLLLYEQSRQALNLDFGGINTLILLTSSLFVVLAIDALKQAKHERGSLFFALALACGVGFIVSKFFEYKEKLEAGISMLSNDFFMYYYIMTGLHLIHVIVGSVVLAVLMVKAKKERGQADLSPYESGATYWHMVDLLWICLFPLLYLIR
jgi:nitric oxide reductase NorE protein